MKLTIDISDRLEEELSQIAAGLRDKGPLHAQIATDAEAFVKARGAATAATEHRTANSLGANPTGHLVDAYQAIEGQSSAEGALLLVPSGGRLAAAFGPVTIRPKSSKFLTIPVAKDSYGKRAGEFGDELFFLRVGPKRQPVLARRQERVETGGFNRSKGKRYDNSKPLEVLYVLTTESNIPEDRNLIPFDDLADAALDSTEEYLDNLIGGTLP
jgi:predicted transcriptional regulator